MNYKGEDYNSEIEYFGPVDHWLSKFIPKFPPCLNGASEEIKKAIKEGFNFAAFKHDVDYEEKKATGFFGRIKNFFRRRKADRRFHGNLEGAIFAIENKLTGDEYDDSLKYAKVAFNAVRIGGVAFYGT